jgi:hypothetical protein
MLQIPMTPKPLQNGSGAAEEPCLSPSERRSSVETLVDKAVCFEQPDINSRNVYQSRRTWFDAHRNSATEANFVSCEPLYQKIHPASLRLALFRLRAGVE